MGGEAQAIVPDLVLLETPVDYLANLARSLWPNAAILSYDREGIAHLLRKVRTALKDR